MTEGNKGSLDSLEALVGEWNVESAHRMMPSTVLHGRTSCEWLEGGGFLIVRTRMDHPDIPNSIAMIGETDGLRMHYFDSRGVARICHTSFTESVWRWWRDAPDLSPLNFSQRFTGVLSSDGNTIDANLEMSEDGSTWEHDMQTTYRRQL